jgi:magnesium-protoporphyrin IX monomethyl ester (oxidative) cyclase
MLDENVDYVVRGEGEIPLQELAAGEDPHTIKGLVFREGGRIFDNGRAQAIEDLDQIPFPFRPGHLLEEYLHSSPRGQHAKQTLSLITSRGCPYDCTFCSVHPVSGYRWRKRSAQNVLEEISYYVERHNVNHLEFEDDNLTLDNQRAGQIFDGISGLNKKITWSANNGLRVDTLSAPLLKKMKDSGCQQVALAVESGSQEVLGLMQKKLSLEKVEEVVQSCSELKISTLAFFLVGYPGETDETFAATVKYIKKLKKLGLRGIGAMIVNAYPGTKLYDYCNSNGYLTCGIKEHIFNDADYVSVVTPDFDSRQVIYWRDLLQGLFHPLRWKIKEFGRIFFPALVFNKLLVFYRNLRDRRIRRLGYVSAR